MCGICGYINFDRTKRVQEDVLKAMTDTLVHRGPDDSGIFVKGNVGLGHRRLSIIDLATGHQPMLNEDGSLAIVYNGEVYNFREIRQELQRAGHKFRTHSDTEVVLRAYEEYGEKCLEKFNGMFAFCIWDGKRERLFLARDRFGKKPLYYGVFNNQFIFGSEVKALLRHPDVKKEIDISSVARYLAYDYIPSPGSIFKNIFKLKAGCRLIVEKGRLDIAPYWRMRFDHPPEADPREAGQRLIALLKDSVEKRLISDVPLGVFLSGGIDSSCVVAMMADLMNPKDIKTFSIGFKEASYDESSAARLVAEHFGTDHREEILDPDAMLEYLPKIVDSLDEPFADSSIIPTYAVSRFTRQHVTVALGGDGGDELFLGYPSFLAHKIDEYLNFMPAVLRKGLLAPLGLAGVILPQSQNYMNARFKVKRFLRGLDYPAEVRQQAWLGSFVPPQLEELFLLNSELKFDPLDVYETTKALYQDMAGGEAMDRAIYVYVKTYMTDDILTKVDRASMANSLEVRAPFLDASFAAFAASLPASLKMRRFRMKWILKEAFRDRLPEEVLHKPKHGFAVPVGKWLKGELKHLLLEALDKDKIEEEGIFDYNAVKKMVDSYLAGNSYIERGIWSIFMFELWYNKWNK